MKVVVVLVACLVVSTLAIIPQFEDKFGEFVNQYNKQYSVGEFNIRKQIFLNNLKKIEEHNANNNNGFKLGITEFADMTHDEFVSARLSSPYITSQSNKAAAPETFVTDVAPPASLDWRASTTPVVVGPVRNIAQCGDAATDAIVDSISGDYSVRFSEDFYAFDPNYVDECDGVAKCSAHQPTDIWAFISKYGLHWYYDGCPTGPGVGMCITGMNTTTSGSESELVAAVASKGPIVILIDASQPSFQLYVSGVYYDAKCSSTVLNHALLLVGYGSANGADYWIARNSWGASWGQKGDVFLARNKNNNCGVATRTSFAKTVQNCVCEL